MTARVRYEVDGSIAIVTMDDGKVNALSLEMLMELNEALDRAASEGAVVVLSGREGVFSAGFDLAALRAGGHRSMAMVRAGFELAERVLAFPTPVVMACTGHAVAMGVFLLLAGDHRVGAAGPFKFTANEVAIGLTVPRAAVEIVRQRLTPAHVHRALVLAEAYSPETAFGAGFLDQVVDPTELQDAAREAAVLASKLDMGAHAATKLRVRQHALEALRAAIDADVASFRAAARA